MNYKEHTGIIHAICKSVRKVHAVKLGKPNPNAYLIQLSDVKEVLDEQCNTHGINSEHIKTILNIQG